MAHPADREILRLALPAFLALVAEPLFLLADAAIVGHLGTPQLAGLGIAAVVLQTVVGLCVFLAYGTTSSVARHLGAGDLRGALAQGVDGLWLAVLIGVLASAAGVVLTDPLVAAFGAGAEVSDYATTYLRIAFLGVTPLLLMLAATGVLRGLQDTRTPLAVAVLRQRAQRRAQPAAGLRRGPRHRRLGPGLGARPGGLRRGPRARRGPGSPAAARVAASRPPRHRRGGPGLGRPLRAHAHPARGTAGHDVRRGARVDPVGDRDSSVSVATHQLAFTIWTFLAFVLDAVAIAAQAITGRYLGAGDVAATREVTRRMIQWGLVGGAVLGLATIAAAPVVGRLFTEDADVRALLVPVLVVVGLGQPLCGLVFVLDGVLIGAGDGTYLAKAGALVLAVYAPVVLAVAAVAPGLVVDLADLHRRPDGSAGRGAGPARARRRLAGHRGAHPRVGRSPPRTTRGPPRESGTGRVVRAAWVRPG